MHSLEMVECEFVSTSPDRPKISSSTHWHWYKFVIDSLREQKVKAPCSLVYCRSLYICVNLYSRFHYELSDDSPGSDRICKNRLFGMFDANTPKEVILKSLRESEGVVE